MLNALLGRDIDGEPRLALVVLLVHEALLALVQPEEDYLREIERRVVLRNDVVFGAGERFMADDGFDVVELEACELGGGLEEGLDILENQEGCAGVLDSGREEGVVGAQERDAVQRGAFGVLLVWRHVGVACVCNVMLCIRTREVIRNLLSKSAAEHRVDLGMRRLGKLRLGQR